MTNRDRGISMQQQHGHRLADNVAPADDDGGLALHGDALALEQLDAAKRRARDQCGTFLHQQPDVLRMKAVDILQRVNRVEHPLLRLFTHAFGSGDCTRMPSIPSSEFSLPTSATVSARDAD
jgi:hypothetical protein